MEPNRVAFWSIPPEELFQSLNSSPIGLSSSEAQIRRKRSGSEKLAKGRRTGDLTLFLNQFKSPIILILLAAAILSVFLDDRTDALIILTIVFISGILGFWQERGAERAVERLLSIVQIKTTVLRDGVRCEMPRDEIVPGDIVVLGAGDVIPADGRILESKDLFVNEATLTGETYAAEKLPGELPEDTPLGGRTNSLFMGTNVISGTANVLAVHTGKQSEFGRISEHLHLKTPETEFEHGIRHFGYFLAEVTFNLVLIIFAVNVFLKRPVLDSFLFSLALAVGLTPQLLPVIISINLAHGASRMAQRKVIVKRLSSIENLGGMQILCSDKTGTLTEGSVCLNSAIDLRGEESGKVLLYAFINSFYHTGYANAIDNAILERGLDINGYEKVDEIPYDFIRKRLSILVRKDGRQLMITKGALPNVLEICSRVENSDGSIRDIAGQRQGIQDQFEKLSREGGRVLGIACRDFGLESVMNRDHEADMIFFGMLVFSDPPKAGITETIGKLKNLGVALKIITGDNRLIAAHVSRQVGIEDPQITTGSELHDMSDEALLEKVKELDVFAEVEPNHKERIIIALKKSGKCVGFIGDGINDASALHAADVGISVDSAVDVAREAAAVVLLEKDLNVVVQGVEEGRRTFANTLKYVFMATSANFGNMFSMAGASLFLSYLPLLPMQILLTNLLTDFPEITIASDSVDEELVREPHQWDIHFIKKFMLTFGLLSSVFDYLTFGLLLVVFHATTDQFRTGWFMESVVSASLIVLVIRSRRPFFRSMPGRHLIIATLLVIAGTLLIPYSPLGSLLGFVPINIYFLSGLGMIVILYIAAAEITKKIFYGKVKV